MEIKKTEEKDNRLLKRKEVIFAITFDKATPSNKEVSQKISSLQGVDEHLVEIQHIYTKFGLKKATVHVHIYDSIEDLQDIEPPVLVKENG
jgi:small subunit ribosomal protein S24e